MSILPVPEEAQPYFEGDARLTKLLEGVSGYLTNYERYPHHSWGEHYTRVLRNAAVFAREERLPDSRIHLLMAAALIHDIGYHIPHGNDVTHHVVSEKWAAENLGSFGYNEEEVQALRHAVLYHDHKYGHPVDDMGKILHDADTIDKASITGRLFGVAVDPGHPLRREVAHKIRNTLEVARAYLLRLQPISDGSYFYTEAGRRADAGRIDLIKRVFETYLAEQEGRIYRLD